MRGKIILEEHICMPEDNAAEALKFACRNATELAAALADLHDARLAEMNANGVELAIISMNPAGPQAIHDPKESAAYAVRANDYLAGRIQGSRERFAGFASVSMHDPEVAVAELTRCVNDLGFIGVMVHDAQEYTTPQGRVLEYFYDDPRYDIFWAAVEKLQAPVYLHPKPPIPEDFQRLYAKRPWLLGPTYSFARDSSFHVMALCSSGVFDRFPGAQLIIGHMGEMLLSHLHRSDHWFEKRDRGRGLKSQKTLRQYFETNISITTAGNFSTPVLLHAISEIGVDRIMFSIDTPYENVTEGATWLDTQNLSDAAISKIGRLNALKLFPRLAESHLRTEETEKLQQDHRRVLFTRNPGF
ncbi:hypothetical protein CLAIMM_11973 [Cladophialophora immunda]|nr:hypothetical protein CLAIMM_11973 [Cladophialophora immunda]